MDRDKRWERVTLGYDAIVDAKAEATAKTPKEAVDQGYAAGQDDEFVKPTVIDGFPGMKDGDGLMMVNFRADRARQILTALLDPRFDGFNRSRVVKFAMAVGMVEYSAALNPFLKTLYPPEVIKMGLGETVSKAGLKQLRIAETEKYAHVTFFFNGGEETALRGRGAHPGALSQGRDLRSEARDERARGDRQARRRHRLGQVRPDRRQLRQQRHGGPHRQRSMPPSRRSRSSTPASAG